MAKFIPCTGVDGRPVWLNFDEVRKMERLPDYNPPYTRIDFSETHSVSVRETAEELGNAANKK